MGSPPAVLVLDDGELDDVHQMLQELDIPCARIRGGAIVEGSSPPRDLLIATPRRIGAVREALYDSDVPPIRVIVVNEDSNALRAQLRHSGFDYLVRRPVHAEALRLLLLHCVYKGEERRREPRVAVGFEITFRTGLLTRRATLVDLSVRGCRLLSRTRIEPGRRIKLQVPEALDAGDPLTLLGRVVRVESDKGESAETFELGVSFERMNDETRQALEWIVEDRALGPATLRVGTDDVPRPPPGRLLDKPFPRVEARGPLAMAEPRSEPAPERQATEVSPPERRGRQRGVYSQTIPAFGDRALRVLVGRDLSVGGMRIQPQPELELGDRLHLAIYGEPGEEPLLIWGSVVRNDSEHGHAIVFDPVDGPAEARLERLVASLPAVESLHDSEVEAMGTVVSEIVG